jgi:hypothetical protein
MKELQQRLVGERFESADFACRHLSLTALEATKHNPRGYTELLPRRNDVGLVKVHIAGFGFNEAVVVSLTGLVVETTGPFDHASPVSPDLRHGRR